MLFSRINFLPLFHKINGVTSVFAYNTTIDTFVQTAVQCKCKAQRLTGITITCSNLNQYPERQTCLLCHNPEWHQALMWICISRCFQGTYVTHYKRMSC